MVVTIDVVRTRRWRDASALLAVARNRTGGHRALIGAHYTVLGDEVHAPWKPSSGAAETYLRRRDGWSGGIDLRRVFIANAFPDAKAALEFDAAAPWPAGAERWHARLRPIRSTGSIDAADPLDGVCDEEADQAEAGMVLTHANVPARRLPGFFRRLLPAADAQHTGDGALCSFGTASRRGTRFHGFTVSCWRRLEDAMKYAYQDPVHQEAMRWYREGPEKGEAWFARLLLEESTGTLAGTSPFGQDVADTHGSGVREAERA